MSYIDWASQFVDFKVGESVAEAFKGPIPDTSNLEEATLSAAAMLIGFWGQEQAHPDLSAGQGWENPDGTPDTPVAELWQRFGLNLPTSQLKLLPPSHTSDYSDVTMCNNLLPPSGLEPPSGTGIHSDINSEPMGEVPSSSQTQQVESFYGLSWLKALYFVVGQNQNNFNCHHLHYLHLQLQLMPHLPLIRTNYLPNTLNGHSSTMTS